MALIGRLAGAVLGRRRALWLRDIVGRLRQASERPLARFGLRWPSPPERAYARWIRRNEPGRRPDLPASPGVKSAASLGARLRVAVRLPRLVAVLMRSRDRGAAQLGERAGLKLEHSSGVRIRSGEARFTDADPQLVFALPAIDAAVVRFHVDLDVVALSSPEVYLDYGHGITEETRIQVREDETGVSVLLVSPAFIRRIRFDPSRRMGACRIRGLGLTPVSAAEVDGEEAVASAFAAAAQPDAHLVSNGRADALKRVNASVNQTYAQGGLDAYRRWRLRHEPSEEQGLLGRVPSLSSSASGPLFSVLVPVYETSEAYFRAMVESVLGQVYPHWELCLADDASPSPHVRAMIEGYAASDRRIRAVFREANGHISAASNSALELARGVWSVLLDHDDVLAPNALLELAREVEAHPDAIFVYSDEDKLDGEGRRYDPFFKPDYSPELLRSQNYLNHLTAIRTEAIRAAGGWRRGFEGSQDHDLYLRVVERLERRQVRHIPKVLYHWRAAAGSTALSQEGKDYAFEAGQRAVREHVARLGLPVERVERAGPWPFHRVVYALPDPAPRVSLIIPTRDRADLLEACVRSIVERTDYPDYEIVVVDNGSTEPETHALFARLRRDPRIRVLPQPGPFNYSALNNAAAKVATGSILGLVNNDIEVITPLWLREMASWATQPRIGCVGAKLYYPDDTIQHAGVVLGIGGVAGHGHKQRARGDPGYFGRIAVSHEVSAVTGACLMVRRSIWDEVGGLDEALAVAFNDVDLCLRVREAGFANVFTPYAELYHHESLSRGQDQSLGKRARFAREVDFMTRRWRTELERDPFYSLNLSITEDYGISGPTSVTSPTWPRNRSQDGAMPAS